MFGFKESPEEYAARRARVDAERAQRQQEQEIRRIKKQMFENAHAVKKIGDFQTAIIRFTAILKSYPQEAGAYFYRGQCYAALENFQAAIYDYQQTQRINDPWFQKNKLAELRSVFAMAYSKLALLFLQQKDFLSSIKNYDLALTYQQDIEQQAFCYYYRGLSHRGLGNFQQAKSDLEYAIHYNPKQVKFIIQLAEFYEQDFDFRQALTYFNRAIEIDHKQEFLYESKSFCLKKIIENTQNLESLQHYENFLGDCSSR